MTKQITPDHRQQFEEIKKRLTIIGSKEANFLKIELLFYEAITIARTYGDDVQENKLLEALKKLKVNQFQDTKAFFKKSTQREQVIRRFISQLKLILSAANKNQFMMAPSS